MPKIRGRIIRILDPKTVIINLGRRHGIEKDSTFSILAAPEPEPIVDPVTNEELGRVTLIKAKVRASEVYSRFTIAMTSQYGYELPSAAEPLRSLLIDRIVTRELPVETEDIQPWKAGPETPVQVGDVVEVEVPERKAEEPSSSDDSGEEEETESEKAPAENVESGGDENAAE